MMGAQFGNIKIGGMQYGGVTIGEAMMNGQIVYRSGPPVVRITATTPQGAFVQFREALAAYGLDAATVEYLPFQLDTSQATDLSWMFVDCLSLKTVPPMDLSNVTNTEALFWSCNALESVPDLLTGNVVNAKNMFQNCVSLTDGNVRLLGKHPSVNTTGMLTNAALTREPWYSADGLRALVTPAAPTFLAASPWVTLPTQEGVTYWITGTPGYSNTVTVTAAAQAGYELVGTASWTHTYGPEPYFEEVVRYTSVGLVTASVPSWCKEIDFILLGGGGGGYRGNSGNGSGGEGGNPGQYHSGSVTFPYGSVKIQVANGGYGTTGTNANNTDGEGTRIWGPNDEYVGWGQGGAKGPGYGTAETSGPGNQSHAGLTISGGAGAAINQPGGSPGAGGGGGSGGFFGAFNPGRPGGRGEAIIRYRSGPRPA